MIIIRIGRHCIVQVSVKCIVWLCFISSHAIQLFLLLYQTFLIHKSLHLRDWNTYIHTYIHTSFRVLVAKCINRTRHKKSCHCLGNSGSVLQSRLVLSRTKQDWECRPLPTTPPLIWSKLIYVEKQSSVEGSNRQRIIEW